MIEFTVKGKLATLNDHDARNRTNTGAALKRDITRSSGVAGKRRPEGHYACPQSHLHGITQANMTLTT
jgi:hypothetical protein